eukprot:SAG11_NODE_12811_length_684_cov_0.912821_1_plen_144_part_10
MESPPHDCGTVDWLVSPGRHSRALGRPRWLATTPFCRSFPPRCAPAALELRCRVALVCDSEIQVRANFYLDIGGCVQSSVSPGQPSCQAARHMAEWLPPPCKPGARVALILPSGPPNTNNLRDGACKELQPLIPPPLPCTQACT